MKLLLDQNISFRVIKLLSDHFATVSHVKQENLVNASDLDIRRYASSNGYTIVTYDDDFIGYNHLYGPPPKVFLDKKRQFIQRGLGTTAYRCKRKNRTLCFQ